MFQQYLELSDRLVRIADKEQVAECARLLALNVAHYQMKYGELPLDETLAMIAMDKPNQEQLQLMSDGMEIFSGVLGNVVTGIGEQKH